MYLKEKIVDFIKHNFAEGSYTIQEFESGCAMIDLHLTKTNETIVIQAEPEKIGISKISNEPALDFSLPDESFNSFEESINYLKMILVGSSLG